MIRILNNIRDFFIFFFDIFKGRYIVFQLIKRDFQNRYLGSFLGFLWVLIQPTVYIAIMWFVLAFGLKPGAIDGGRIPYHLWFLSGVVPWMFMSELLSMGTTSIMEYSYLIKKVKFRSSIIPLIKIATGSIIHIFMLLLMCVVFYASGFSFSIQILQLFYYFFASVVFFVGVLWLTSSVSIFLKDIPQVVTVIVQVMFWATPIIWQYQQLPEKLAFLYKVNPFFYIINGYRDSFLGGDWFWQHPKLMLFYWALTFFFFVVGAVVFKKLKAHFADVL